MKKEDLIAQGLTEEQAKFVMTEHGKTVTTLNAQIDTLKQSETDLKTQNTKHEQDLATLKKDNADNEALQKRITDLETENTTQKTEHEAALTAIQRESALTALLSDSKVKNAKAVSALLDQEKIIFKDGELSGAKEQIEALQKSDGYLFELGSRQSGYDPVGGGNHNPDESGSFGKEVAESVVPEIKKNSYFS